MFGKQNAAPDACLRALKRWLIRGFSVPVSDPCARDVHMSLDARAFIDVPCSDSALDAKVVAALDAARTGVQPG
jgi:hypothetical protein